MKAPVVLAWVALLLFFSTQVVAETCEYDIELELVPGRCCAIKQVTSQFLQTPIDLNTNHADIDALRTQVSFEPVFANYLNISLTLVEFAETEEEANRRWDKVKTPAGLPAVIRFADDSTMTLVATSMYTTEPGTRIDPPGQLFNTSKQYRVTHYTGAMYKLDDEQIETLRAQPVVDFQVTTTQGDFDIVVHPSRRDRFQYVLGCI